MGYENLYGIGRGSAQVWGRNVGLDYLQQTFDQDRKRREKEDAELQAQVSKIDISKVRQPDQEDAYAMYDNVKTLFRQYQNTTNKQERRRLESEMDNAKREVQDFVGLSQTTAQRELELYKVRTGKAKMHRDYAPNYMALTSARIADPNYKTLAEKATGSIYAAEFDEDKFLKNVEARAVEQINDPKVLIRNIAGGGVQRYQMRGTKVNPEKLATQIIEEAKTDEGLRDQIIDRNPNLPFAEATKAYITYAQELLESKNKVEEKPLVGYEAPDRFYAHERWKKANGIGDGSEGGEKELYTQKLLTGILNGEKGYKEILYPYLPAGASMELHTSKATATSKGGYKVLRVNIPAITKIAGTNVTIVREAVKKDIPISKGDAFNELNAIVGQYGTGLKTTMPKLNTVEGRGKGEVYKSDIDKSQRNSTTSTTKSVSSPKKKKTISNF